MKVTDSVSLIPRKMTLFVCSMMALASLAKKYSTESELEPLVSTLALSSALLRALIRDGFLFLKESDLCLSAVMFFISSLVQWTGMESASRPNSDLIPTTMGEPRLVATHSRGKRLDLKTQANAPSSWEMVCSTNCL